jgi:hypothetical protein
MGSWANVQCYLPHSKENSRTLHADDPTGKEDMENFYLDTGGSQQALNFITAGLYLIFLDIQMRGCESLI